MRSFRSAYGSPNGDPTEASRVSECGTGGDGGGDDGCANIRLASGVVWPSEDDKEGDEGRKDRACVGGAESSSKMADRGGVWMTSAGGGV